MSGLFLASSICRFCTHVGVPQGSLGVQQVVASGGERDPLSFGNDLSHGDTHVPPSLLDRGGHPRLPLVESLPSRLDRSDDTLLEVSRVLLHDDDRLLQGVLLVDLRVQENMDLLDGETEGSSDTSVLTCFWSCLWTAKLTANGSSLEETLMGVLVTAPMALAKSAMALVDISLSLATPAASLPVSFWTFLM